jgi:hypothetical protein
MIAMHTATERPDLWERGIDSASVWPEYNLHGDTLNQWWGLLDVELADFQFVLYDDAEDTVVAEGHTGITGTVAEWESWTGLAFPESADYVFPEGLATVHIDRNADRGSYWEPNVWMVHPEVSSSP